MNIKIGTRASQLALWQANFVEYLLRINGFETEIVGIQTKGDKKLDVSIAKIGSKGVFTEELEAMLDNGDIDIAVHSAKDLQSDLDGKYKVLAITRREKPHDVFVSTHDGLTLDKAVAQGLTIGTSSTRRIAILKHLYPNIKIVDIRGNLQTRINKMKEGHCDGIILAYAGIYRMNFTDYIQEELPLDVFTPPAGQGAILVECMVNYDQHKHDAIKNWVNHLKTEHCVLAERAFLRKLHGGCSIPVFAHAHTTEENSKISLHAGIYSLDGTKVVKDTMLHDFDRPEELGEMLGEKILSSGGKEILDSIK